MDGDLLSKPRCTGTFVGSLCILSILRWVGWTRKVNDGSPFKGVFKELCDMLNDELNSHLFQYLRDVSNKSQFALSIVQILVEEQRQPHQDRHNKNKTPAAFKVGDIVKAHVQVQSNASKGQVGKLSYQARGPFKIISDLGQRSIEVQKLDKPDSAVRRYKSADLCLLPPSLFPPEPLGMMDQWYLDYKNALIVLPL